MFKRLSVLKVCVSYWQFGIRTSGVLFVLALSLLHFFFSRACERKTTTLPPSVFVSVGGPWFKKYELGVKIKSVYLCVVWCVCWKVAEVLVAQSFIPRVLRCVW